MMYINIYVHLLMIMIIMAITIIFMIIINYHTSKTINNMIDNINLKIANAIRNTIKLIII